MDHTNSLYYIIEYEGSTGITRSKNESTIPVDFVLYQNYPNPFNPATTIKYNLLKSGDVIFNIYNLAGQNIKTLVNGFQKMGEHEITWQPEGLPNGIYFYRLQAGDYLESKKLILQK